MIHSDAIRIATKERCSDQTIAGSHMYRPLNIHALRILELTGRDSSVMRHAESEFMIRSDPILSTFRAFARVTHLATRSSLAVAEPEQFAETIEAI